MSKNDQNREPEGITADSSTGLHDGEEVAAELRQSQKTLQSIFRASPTGIGLVRNQVFLRVNQRFCGMLGYSEDELVGHRARMLYLSDDEYERVERVQDRQIEGQGIGTVETRWVGKDGRLLDIILSSAPLDAADRSSPVTFTALDISARKKATADLERTEKLLRTVTETVGESVFTKDLERRYTFVNQGMADTLGIAVSDLIGKTPDEVFEPKTAALIAEVDSAAFAGEKVDAHRTLQVGDGYITFHTIQAPLRNEDGEVVGVCGVVRDVSEQRRAEEERLALTARVQQAQKLESLGVLAGGIAHDFNNLLVGVLGNAEVALLELAEDEPVHAYVSDIRTTALRAGELIRQMMAYSGKSDMEIETVDLPAVVADMGHLLEASVSKHAKVIFDFSPDTPAIAADIAQVRQVVMNLITNASDSIGERPGVINVRTGDVTLSQEAASAASIGVDLPAGSYAFFEVADSGCGMPEDNLSRIFDPFFSTKFAGRGLGLAVVAGIAKRHKSGIEVHSEVGIGSVFRILFPTSSGVLPESAPEPASPTAWQGSGTVLLVDDEEMVRIVGERILTRMGFEVVLAEDGHEAVSIFREDPTRFACVLLDLAMPVMDGEECLRELRRILPAVRVVLSSGYHECDIRSRFDGLGLAGFVRKPYRFGDLQDAIRQAVEG